MAKDMQGNVDHYASKLQQVLDRIYDRYRLLVNQVSGKHFSDVDASVVTLVKGWCSNKIAELKNDLSERLSSLRNYKDISADVIRLRMNQICNKYHIAMAESAADAEIYLKQKSNDAKPSDTYVGLDYYTQFDISTEAFKTKVTADMQILESEVTAKKFLMHA